jgi:hypothetical protein
LTPASFSNCAKSGLGKANALWVSKRIWGAASAANTAGALADTKVDATSSTLARRRDNEKMPWFIEKLLCVSKNPARTHETKKAPRTHGIFPITLPTLA